MIQDTIAKLAEVAAEDGYFLMYAKDDNTKLLLAKVNIPLTEKFQVSEEFIEDGKRTLELNKYIPVEGN